MKKIFYFTRKIIIIILYFYGIIFFYYAIEIAGDYQVSSGKNFKIETIEGEDIDFFKNSPSWEELSKIESPEWASRNFAQEWGSPSWWDPQ